MNQCVCLIQGPFSPLFSKVANSLVSKGVRVVKVNFCAGDALFSKNIDGALVLDFKGTLEEWPMFVGNLITEHEVTSILGHGDCHYYNEVAFGVAKSKDVKVFVSEEGYIRPDYITLEEGGVNAYSSLMDDDFSNPVELLETKSASECSASFTARSILCMWYYTYNSIFKHRYPNYKHRRSSGLFKEMFCWLRSMARSLKASKHATRETERLVNGTDRYFVVPLQVHCDSQVLIHSDFQSVDDFIKEVLFSFSIFGDGAKLIFKHHPYCIGFSDYTESISRLSKALCLEDSVVFVKGGNLPRLLKGSAGVLTINSTVGISALHHGVPLFVAGRAFFSKPGLSYQGGMDNFWKGVTTPNKDIYSNMLKTLKNNAMLNASLYSDFEESAEKIAGKVLCGKDGV